VLTSTVGIGSQYSPIQLQAISEAGGGRMHDAELPDEIAEIMFAELTDALATTVESLELALRLPKGVEAEIYGPTPLNRDAEGCEVLVGSMIAGGLRQVVVKLKFPSGQAGDALPVAVSARWKTPGQEAARTAEVAALAASFDTPAACLAQPRSREIARVVAEQWQAHIYHRALMLNQDGQYEAAHAFVERERRFFDRYCHDLPEMRSSVHEVHSFAPTVHHAYQAISSKEMLLRAYKTSRGETDRRRRKRQVTSDLIAEEAARQRGES
jgi:Ca-activated chloride channel family protein